MNFVQDFNEWNLKRQYANLGVARANILFDRIDSPELEYLPLEYLDLIEREMKILEAKYIQAGYRVVDFLSERVKKERDLRPRDVQRLLVKNVLNEALS